MAFLFLTVWPMSYSFTRTSRGVSARPECFERLHGFGDTAFQMRCGGFGPVRGSLEYWPGPCRRRIPVRPGDDAGRRASARIEAVADTGDRRRRRGDPRTVVQG